MTAFISLTTDFGTSDFGVGEMLGVIYAIAGEDVRVADLTHDVPPQNVLDAAVILGRHTPYFPEGSIHIVVVDPGVGTHRRPIAARLGKQFFVGPDNGVFTLMLRNAQRDGEPVQVVHTNRPRYWLENVSAIFHGRDIFAAVGAHLAAGVPLEELGEIINDPVLLDLAEPRPIEGGWEGVITRVDHFGNLESNIDASLIKDLGPVDVIVGGAAIHGLVETFGAARAGDLVAMIDSSGVIAVSVVNGSAAGFLNVAQGDSFRILKTQP